MSLINYYLLQANLLGNDDDEGLGWYSVHILDFIFIYYQYNN